MKWLFLAHFVGIEFVIPRVVRRPFAARWALGIGMHLAAFRTVTVGVEGVPENSAGALPAIRFQRMVLAFRAEDFDTPVFHFQPTSKAWAAFSSSNSPRGFPSNCKPTGKSLPSAATVPHGTLIPQMPARLVEIV